MPDASDIIITHLKVESFGGLKLLDIDIPRGGVVFAGTKGEGKTTALRAVRALVEGVGVDAGAIHLDEAKASLAIDFEKAGEAFRAKRSITRKGTTAELTRADGTPVPRAREQLRAIFGERPLDPLALLNADAKERRRILLEAMPCNVTADDLNRWCETSQEWSTDGHGHEVLARVREKHFAARTVANAKLDDVRDKLNLAHEEAARTRPELEEAMSPDAARTHVSAAERSLAVLHERMRADAEREQREAATRVKMAELRAKAEAILARPEAVGASDAELELAGKEMDKAEQAFQDAQAHHTAACSALKIVQNSREQAERLMAEAKMYLDNAEQLDTAVATDADTGAPISVQVTAAESALERARALVSAAEASEVWRQAKAKSSDVEALMKAAEAEAEKLDRVVKRLSKDAPAELAKRSDSIPGLEITPTSILFEGKDIDRLSEGEKLILCVDIAKRAAAGAKVLCLDGLEKLPPSLQPGFIRKCLEGGWVVFATRVQDGEMRIIDCYQLAGMVACPAEVR